MNVDDHRSAGPVPPPADVLASSCASSTTDADADADADTVLVLEDGSVIDGFPS